MSFQRLDKQLNTRLVAADDSDDGPETSSLGAEVNASPSQKTVPAGAALSTGNAARLAASASPSSSSSASSSPPTPLISVFTSHSLNKALGPSNTTHASHNNPMHSSLAGGHQRDMELVDLGGGTAYEAQEEDFSHPVHVHHGGVRDHVLGGDSRRSGDDDDDGKVGADATSPRPARIWPAVLRDGWKAYLLRSFKAVFLGSKMNLLLLCVPIAILCKIAGFGDGPLFVFSLLGLCPLAERIAFVTDELAMYTNDTVGGLLSATMGNATEMIVSIFALKNGLLRIVQLSLIGSVFSNLLLVQGSAFLLGGLKYTQQKFSQAAAKTNVALLLLSVMGLFFPMVLLASDGISELVAGELTLIPGLNTSGLTNPVDEGITLSNELKLSRFASCWLLFIYALLILYQLKTHAHLFESREEPEDDAEEPEPPVLGWYGSIIWAVIVTIFISILSEFIVSAMDGAAKSIHIPVLFSATILLPIVGNAAEHASALIFARRDQMDIALGISVGSSTQIALFVIPLMVVLGWIADQPLSLDFQVFETVSLFLTVILSSLVLSTGKSDWLYGAMMIIAYMIIAASFWWQRQPEDLKGA